MICPHCRKDIAEQVVLSAAASIMAKRRAKITPEQARAMQEKSVVARRKNRPE